ncbi:MAG TPA: hypothetical protein VH256_06825 [Thermoleophilaceae bacterium]|jgi:hypothetical protein|nr:hypothetical protein [Thermoleophilaceae bacterium]
MRTLVRWTATAAIAGLAYLTLRVALEQGVDVLVIVSFVLLAILGIGVFGALGSDE